MLKGYSTILVSPTSLHIGNEKVSEGSVVVGKKEDAHQILFSVSSFNDTFT